MGPEPKKLVVYTPILMTEYYKWFLLILLLWPCNWLYAFWMNHIRRISIIKKNVTRALSIAAENILKFFCGLSASECRSPRLEPSQKGEDSPADSLNLLHKQCTPEMPSQNIAGGIFIHYWLFYTKFLCMETLKVGLKFFLGFWHFFC